MPINNEYQPFVKMLGNFKIYFLLAFLLFWHGFNFSPAECTDVVGRVNSEFPTRKEIATPKVQDINANERKQSLVLHMLRLQSLKNPNTNKGVWKELYQRVKQMDKVIRSSPRQLSVGRQTRDTRARREIGDLLRDWAAYYVDSILWNYGNTTFISRHNFEHLLENIGLGMMANLTDDHEHHHDHGDHEHGDHEHGDHGHGEHGHGEHGHGEHGHGEHGHGDHDHGDHDHGDHDHGDHDQHHVHKRDETNTTDVDEEEEEEQCLTSTELLTNFGLQDETELYAEDLLYLSPALIYFLDSGICKSKDEHSHENMTSKESGQSEALIWVYTMVSVFIISLCALFGILCIPKKGRNNYHLILQFLMALAMGSMSGDGLLHLIPHSMTAHEHSSEGDEGGHDHHHEDEKEKSHGQNLDPLFKGLVALLGIYGFFFLERVFAVIRARSDARKKKARSGKENPMLAVKNDKYDEDKKEDEDQFDSHGHSHEGMFTCTPLAMMIIVGDMFHNFCDGLAIGAAFYGSLSLGLSTSIAVFCHELPHEIGDFAVLIKSGMSKKRAIAFNLLSTVPCFFGAIIGLKLGSLGEASNWIFALVGGMFIYISLVDLIPEMTKAYVDMNGPWLRYMILHWAGMILGVLMMLILGIFEDDLQNLLT